MSVALGTSAQKRARQQLSCTFCRSQKLRCDRQRPCDQCMKRERSDNCQYLAAPPKKPRNRNTRDRIAHLEGLVVQLMNQKGTPDEATKESPDSNESPPPQGSFSDTSSATLKNSPSSSTDDSYDAAAAFGQMKISNGETYYVGNVHWEAVLSGIEELKATLGDDANGDEPSPSREEDIDDRPPSPTAALLLDELAPVTRESLLQSIPSRKTTDQILWQWFNSSNPELPAVHRPTFIKEYGLLWEHPDRLPTMWLAMFFSILSLGTSAALFGAGSRAVEVKAELGDPNQYKKLAAQALSLANYTNPKKWTVEALVMYGAAEHSLRPGQPFQLWLRMSTVMRIAMRMGYHREPSLFPGISIFEGEMRRRVWNILYIFDVLSSFACGMPDMIRQVQADAGPPRNLLDSDFDVNTVEVPPARPLDEITPVSYIIIKSTIAMVFAKAADISHAVEAPDYQEITALEQELDRAYADTPARMRDFSLTHSLADPAQMIFHRFKLENMYQKTRCTLHRRYLSEHPRDQNEERSRGICVDAAIKILSQLETIYNASQDGGQLSHAPYFLNALSAHDFLLAAMILCLELNRLSKIQLRSDAENEHILKMRELLETTHRIYTTPTPYFTPPDKAMKAMEVMIVKVRKMAVPDPPALDVGKILSNMPAVLPLDQQVPVDPILFNPYPQQPLPIDNPANAIDWGSWDKLIHDQMQPDEAQPDMLWDPTLDFGLPNVNASSVAEDINIWPSGVSMY